MEKSGFLFAIAYVVYFLIQRTQLSRSLEQIRSNQAEIMSSLPSQSGNKKNSPNVFRIRTFLLRSYSFGIETINTSIRVRFRSSLENHTQSQTKMGKVFSDQKGPKPLPFPYIREYPPDPDPFQDCQIIPSAQSAVCVL